MSKKAASRDYDPFTDQIMEAVERQGHSVAYVAQKSGVSTTTLYNYRRQRVYRPQRITLEFIANSVGLTFELVPISDNARRRNGRGR